MFKAKINPKSSRNECRDIAKPSDKEEENFIRILKRGKCNYKENYLLSVLNVE